MDAPPGSRTGDGCDRPARILARWGRGRGRGRGTLLARGMSVASQVTDLLADAHQDAKLATMHESDGNLEGARDAYLSATTNLLAAMKLEKDPHRKKTMRAHQTAWMDRIEQIKSSPGGGALGQPPPGIGAMICTAREAAAAGHRNLSFWWNLDDG